MMKQVLRRGFTLIELLVVIAIIGILASVVLASLNDARDKGEDAQAKQQVASIRSEAELSYDNNNRVYDQVCEDSAALLDLNGDGTDDITCEDDDDVAGTWMAYILLTNGTDYYCADYTGATYEGATDPAAQVNGQCP